MPIASQPDTPDPLIALRPAADRILEVQAGNGAIAWFEEGPWDPWNHVECAMALVVMGYRAEAVAAYDTLLAHQRGDGAWLGDYGNALPMVDRDYISREKAPALIDSNFCAYPAVGVAHFLETTGDHAQVRRWWPMVRRALDFVLTLQRADGTISWSFEAAGTDKDDALLAGNASIAKSLECGIYLARAMGETCGPWCIAYAQLANRLATRPDLFDHHQTGSRFAMDWYYPVLAGTSSRADAKDRIAAGWETFVDASGACRCVHDEPWVTIAETAELAMALLRIGDRKRAGDLLNAIERYRDPKGVFWMGWQTKEEIVWPKERPTWTQAAVILATDALHKSNDGGNLLTRALVLEPS